MYKSSRILYTGLTSHRARGIHMQAGKEVQTKEVPTKEVQTKASEVPAAADWIGEQQGQQSGARCVAGPAGPLSLETARFQT